MATIRPPSGSTPTYWLLDDPKLVTLGIFGDHSGGLRSNLHVDFTSTTIVESLAMNIFRYTDLSVLLHGFGGNIVVIAVYPFTGSALALGGFV